MNKEQKILFIVTMLPLLRDYAEDLKDEFPNIWKQTLKKATNDFINEVDKLGHMVTEVKQEEVRQQYQDIYMVHLGISKELFNN
jgi:hypothetical protein